MTDSKDFQAKIQRIGSLVSELEKTKDEEAKASAKALMQLLMDMHAVGLEQIMETIAKDSEAGQRLIDNLGSDALVSSLLVLYGLHPLDFESRVIRAIDKVSPALRKAGGELELVAVDQTTVRLRLQVQSQGCGSTKNTLKSMVEDAIYEAAPDLSELLIEGLEEQAGSNGFVPLGKLGGAIAMASGIQQ